MNTIPSSLIEKVITAAKSRGMTQKALAAAAGIAPEVLSRLKKKPVKSSLEKLVDAAGVHLEVLPGTKSVLSIHHKYAGATFRERHPTLVWSNPDAGDQVYIQRALLRPEFSVLLDAAVEFGLAKVEAEWASLSTEGSDEVTHSRSTTERILKNIRYGYQQVTA